VRNHNRIVRITSLISTLFSLCRARSGRCHWRHI